MIKFVVTLIAKLLSNRRESLRPSGRAVGTAMAGIRSARVVTADATRLVGPLRSSERDPEAGFFEYEDPNDRLAWPARDCVAKPRDAHAGIDPAPPPVMRSLGDVTRLVRPARTSVAPADRTVLLKSVAFSGRPVADATRIITPRSRP